MRMVSERRERIWQRLINFGLVSFIFLSFPSVIYSAGPLLGTTYFKGKPEQPQYTTHLPKEMEPLSLSWAISSAKRNRVPPSLAYTLNAIRLTRPFQSTTDWQNAHALHVFALPFCQNVRAKSLHTCFMHWVYKKEHVQCVTLAHEAWWANSACTYSSRTYFIYMFIGTYSMCMRSTSFTVCILQDINPYLA